MTDMRCVPKLLGADIELGNFVMGRADPIMSVREASRALLFELASQAGESVDDGGSSVATNTDPQDWGRVFLPSNGSCAYIDLDHLELCLPEVRSAWDFVAAWEVMLRLARNAQSAVNARRSPEHRIYALANNSDGRGNSFGSHLNVLVSREVWNNIVHRKPHYLAFLSAFQASSLPLTGQGKVGSENGVEPVDYQISQRADFIETLAGTQTTFFRPLVNTRDEALCGRLSRARPDIARLHVIFYDTTLCQVATLLKVGTIQLVLAMMEAGRVDPSLALDDPIHALRRWSHDPLLEEKASLVSGERLTAVELQRRFLEAVRNFVESGAAQGIVPRANEIITLWDDTLDKLERRDWDSLAGRLDWVLKRSILERALSARPDLTWNSPELKHLDLLYASIDSADSLHASFADCGLTERAVSARQIDRLVSSPPLNTRAWARAMLQRHAGSAVEHVDWDVVRMRSSKGSDTWRVDLSDPLASHRGVFAKVDREGLGVHELVRLLGATVEPRDDARVRCPCGCGRFVPAQRAMDGRTNGLTDGP